MFVKDDFRSWDLEGTTVHNPPVLRKHISIVLLSYPIDAHGRISILQPFRTEPYFS